MEKQTLETKKIVHNNISYLQYDLAKDQAKTSFFDISDINAIKELPQMYKDIIYLYYLEEFTTKEIAKMLNISVNTVWKRVERAKRLLKETLEQGEQ